MTLRIRVVVGNPRPLSRTRNVAMALVEELAGRLGGGPHDVRVIDLADHVQDVFAWPSESMQELGDAVAGSDLAVFASPTYKATYTGLLKAFLDRYPSNGLAGVVAIPLLTGAGPAHTMGSTVNLAPLLMELGATVPGRGLYYVVEGPESVEDAVTAAADVYAANLSRLARVGGLLPDAAER